MTPPTLRGVLEAALAGLRHWRYDNGAEVLHGGYEHRPTTPCIACEALEQVAAALAPPTPAGEGDVARLRAVVEKLTLPWNELCLSSGLRHLHKHVDCPIEDEHVCPGRYDGVAVAAIVNAAPSLLARLERERADAAKVQAALDHALAAWRETNAHLEQAIEDRDDHKADAATWRARAEEAEADKTHADLRTERDAAQAERDRAIRDRDTWQRELAVELEQARAALELVRQLRELQRRYFKHREQDVLIEAKQLERKVDAALDAARRGEAS